MDEHLKNLMKSYMDSLDDHGKFYVYTVKAMYGEMDISRLELKVAGIDLMSDVEAVCLKGYKTCTDGSKEIVIKWVSKIMIGVPRLVSKYPTYLEVEIAVPKLVVEEPGGELGVYKELLSFVTNLYLQPGVKPESKELNSSTVLMKERGYGKYPHALTSDTEDDEDGKDEPDDSELKINWKIAAEAKPTKHM